MHESEDKEFHRIVKSAIEPVGMREPPRDLWHDVRIKLPRPGISVSVLDWVLVALVVILCVLAPEAFFALLAHL